jgi:hypothetical protein
MVASKNGRTRYYHRYLFGFSFESRDASAAIRRFACKKCSGLPSLA